MLVEERVVLLLLHDHVSLGLLQFLLQKVDQVIVAAVCAIHGGAAELGHVSTPGHSSIHGILIG